MPEDINQDPSLPPIPSSPEIRVRTMESDIAAIASRGGTVAAGDARPLISKGIEGDVYSFAKANREPLSNFLSPKFLIVIGIIAILLLLGYIGYVFVRPLLSALATPEADPPATLPPPIVLPPAPPAALAHESFFRIEPDGVFEFTFTSGPARSVADLQTFSQKLLGLLSGKSGTLFEIRMKNENGNQISAGDFFSRIDAPVIERNFLAENFNPDFTVFAYKDAKGYSLGYVLGLKKGATPALVKPKVPARIEGASAEKIANLFLKSPGAPRGGFGDAEISERPARTLSFEGGAKFTYVWFNNNLLVLGTSDPGIEEAFFYLGR